MLFAYTVIMMIGSVHLGWHYALDGYVAIVGVWVIWWSVGRVLRREPYLTGKPPHQRFPAECRSDSIRV